VQHNLPVTDHASQPASPSAEPPRATLPDEPLPAARRLGEGYDADQVDAFVGELRQALRHDPPAMAPYEVADQRFRVRRTGRRYALRAVDEHLAVAQEVLRVRHGADAVAALQGHASPPRHFPTWWIYAVALVLVAVIVGYAVTQF
jgi:hypothetical protein